MVTFIGSNSPFRASLMKPKRPDPRDPRGLQVRVNDVDEDDWFTRQTDDELLNIMFC